ncbi:head completion/stabilization protein [Rivihabitans pingtungensis]|uniref:Head completion protein GPL n=1 Tax=Rivihabitans pingtungensis TaxID=1054498 RepID=A0A318L0V4_9NEIS|nr:head completion/stabilization protein [Rivihabitans pingtungensis]PXX79163.1 head completion protein GPL [Rivihabitans pingtungensis]
MAQQSNQFVAVQVTAGGAPADDGEPITSAAFWPAIDPKMARQTMRLDGTVTAMRLRSALITAIAQINSDLQLWRTRQQSAGASALADVTAEQIDGISTVVHAYVQAVYCTATAALLERMRDYDTTWEGHTRADRATWPIDDYKRDAWYAIQQILAAGVPGDDRHRHNVIELL